MDPINQNDQDNQNLSQQYQDILDRYAKDLAQKNIPQTSPEPIENTPPTPDIPDSPPIDELVTPPASNLFKYIFYLSLVIFIGVCLAIVYNLYFKTSSSTNDNSTTITPTSTVATVSTITPSASILVCSLNDQNYEIDQSFKSADGCNICTCTKDLNITCTEMACESTPSIKLTPTKSATISAKVTTTPSDLITLIKSTAATEAKTTVSKVVIGETKIIGNYAQVAFNITTGGGSIYWTAKVNGVWKVVTSGQEPPICSVLSVYNFPSDFECNQ